MSDWMYEWVEWIAVLLNFLYVIFAAKQQRFCWVLGGFASLISIFLFVHVRLYSEAVLYFVYVIMAFIGWKAWKQNSSAQGGEILDAPFTEEMITELTFKEHLILWIVGTGLALTVAFIFNMTDAQRPVLDAFTTSFSLIATWLTVKKVLSNWVYWILIDLVTVFLYISRGLEVYAGQMFIFSILAAWGLYSWKKQYDLSKASA